MEEPIDTVGILADSWIEDKTRDYKRCPHKKEENKETQIIRCPLCKKSWPIRVKWIKV